MTGALESQRSEVCEVRPSFEMRRNTDELEIEYEQKIHSAADELEEGNALQYGRPTQICRSTNALRFL